MISRRRGLARSGQHRFAARGASAVALALQCVAAHGAQGPDLGRVASLEELRLDAPPSSGTLTASDPVASERHYDDWRLHLEAGQTVQIDLGSNAFDTLLELWRPGESQPVADNDDASYGILDSRLTYAVAETDDYVVRAQHLYAASGYGAYNLSARLLTGTTEVHDLSPNSSVMGTLTSDSPVSADLGRVGRGLRYDEYLFQGREGDRVRIDMTSSALDPRLQLLDSDRTLMQSDNNGGDGLNSRIVAALPHSGPFRVRAAASSEQSGRYTLLLRIEHAITPESIPQLRLNQLVSDGHLGGPQSEVRLRSGERARIDYFYNLYWVQVQRGETVTVTMRATGFEPVLDAGAMSLLGFAAAETDDDNSNGQDAQLVLTPQDSGRIYLRARSAGSNGGRFTLAVVPGRPAAAPQN